MSKSTEGSFPTPDLENTKAYLL